MESSDPIISSDGARERSNNRRKFSIPSAAANLLLEPEVPVKGINLMDEMEQEEEQMFEVNILKFTCTNNIVYFQVSISFGRPHFGKRIRRKRDF